MTGQERALSFLTLPSKTWWSAENAAAAAVVDVEARGRFAPGLQVFIAVAKAVVQSSISALQEIGAEDPEGQGGGPAAGKTIVNEADVETDTDGDGDTVPLSEGIEDGFDLGEMAKHRLRDGEDIEAELREQVVTHKV